VFIFGGPGTQKGKYIDCLVDLYGFHCLTICRVLEEQLGETHVYELRTSELAEITLSTVMQWITARMDNKRKAPGFIIDIVPNIKVSIRAGFSWWEAWRPWWEAWAQWRIWDFRKGLAIELQGFEK